MEDTLICLLENETSIIENDSHFSFTVGGVSLKAFPTVSVVLALTLNYVYRASTENINEKANKQKKNDKNAIFVKTISI